MSGVHIIPFGTSEPQDFQLLNDGVAFNGTGITLSIEIETPRGVAISPIPVTAVWLSESTGTVRVTGIEDLALGRYRVRYVITSGSLIGYIPNGHQPDIWHVVEV